MVIYTLYLNEFKVGGNSKKTRNYRTVIVKSMRFGLR